MLMMMMIFVFVLMRMLMTMTMVMFAHSVLRVSCETFGYALFHARMHGAHTFAASRFTEQALSSSAYCCLPMVSFLAYLRLTRAFVVLVLLADVRGIVFDGRFGKSLFVFGVLQFRCLSCTGNVKS